MRKFVAIALACLGSSLLLATVQPAYAERPRAVGEVIECDQDSRLLKDLDQERAHKILNDYLYQSQQLDKIDNDVRYMIGECAGLQGKDLGSFIQSRIIPKNSEGLSHASSITSSSSAIRKLNDEYMKYAQLRSAALNMLAEIAYYKMPAGRVMNCLNSLFAGSYSSGSMEIYSKEHVPLEVRERLGALRTTLDSLYSIRNKYLNDLAYVKRNPEECITPDER